MPFSPSGVSRECGVPPTRTVMRIASSSLSSSCCAEFEHLDWLKKYRASALRLLCPRGTVHLDLIHLFFSKPSAIPCNVDVPCHFPNMGKPGKERPGDEHVIMSDHSKAVDRTLCFSLSLSPFAFPPSRFLFPVLLEQTPTLPRVFTRSQLHVITGT